MRVAGRGACAAGVANAYIMVRLGAQGGDINGRQAQRCVGSNAVVVLRATLGKQQELL